jgi:hypothetical protein
MDWWRRLILSLRRKRIAFIAISSSVFLYIVLAAIGGIIGNRTDYIFLELLKYATSEITVSLKVWHITLIGLTIAFFPFSCLFIFTQIQLVTKVQEKDNELYKAQLQLAISEFSFDLSTKINEFDGSLWLLISRLKQNKNRQLAVNQLLNEFLAKIRELIPQVSKAWLCLPDVKDKDYLIPYFSDPQDFPQFNYPMRFYIGDDPGMRKGLVGCAYCEWDTQVTSISMDETGSRTSSNKEYIFFGNKKTNSHSTTAAFVVINDDDVRLGVLCVDSYVDNFFELPGTKALLEQISIRLARILGII